MLLVKDWLPKAVADGDDLDARAHMLVACACKRPAPLRFACTHA